MLRTGEIVRIKEGLKIGNTYGGAMYNRYINSFKGKKLTVIKTFPGLIWAQDTEITHEMVILASPMVVLG